MLPLLVAVLSCACAALWLLRAPLRRWRRLLALSARLPGPPLPLLRLWSDVEPLQELEGACRRYGTPCRVWVGCQLLVLLSDAEHTRAVLGGPAFHQRQDQWAGALRAFTGGGLVTAEDHQGWRLRRRLVEQTLTAEWTRAQLGWLHRVAAQLVSALQRQQQQSQQKQSQQKQSSQKQSQQKQSQQQSQQKQSQQESQQQSQQQSQQKQSSQQESQQSQQQVERELAACALDALSGCLLGQQARATGRPDAGFPHHFLQAARLLADQAAGWPRPLPRPLLRLTSLGEAESRLARQLRGHIDAAIDSAMHSSTCDQESHIALSWERTAEAGDDPDRLPGSALERLLGLVEGEGAEQRRLLREELTSLLLVAQPATRAALQSALQLLALHPEVQSAAARDRPLLRCCALESLRLLPPLPLVGRRLSCDVTLPPAGGGGDHVTLPAGCAALVCARLTHRDPTHWPRPDAFQPDRFLEESTQGRHPFSFLAFGGVGPRRCPGSELALQQVLAALEGMLGAFRVEPAPQGAQVAPRSGLPLKLLPL